MNTCSIDLNFLESNSELVIRNLVYINPKQFVSTEYQWYKGNQGKSYGGFVKKIISGERVGLKAYILPKATKLYFEENKDVDVEPKSLNKNNRERIPGNLTLIGENKKLYFFEKNNEGGDRLLTSFNLCESQIDVSQSTLGDVPEDDTEIINLVAPIEYQNNSATNNSIMNNSLMSQSESEPPNMAPQPEQLPMLPQPPVEQPAAAYNMAPQTPVEQAAANIMIPQPAGANNMAPEPEQPPMPPQPPVEQQAEANNMPPQPPVEQPQAGGNLFSKLNSKVNNFISAIGLGVGTTNKGELLLNEQKGGSKNKLADDESDEEVDKEETEEDEEDSDNEEEDEEDEDSDEEEDTEQSLKKKLNQSFKNQNTKRLTPNTKSNDDPTNYPLKSITNSNLESSSNEDPEALQNEIKELKRRLLETTQEISKFCSAMTKAMPNTNAVNQPQINAISNETTNNSGVENNNNSGVVTNNATAAATPFNENNQENTNKRESQAGGAKRKNYEFSGLSKKTHKRVVQEVLNSLNKQQKKKK